MSESPALKKYLCGISFGGVGFISWIYDIFMLMVNDKFHYVYEIKEGRLFWSICVATEMHSKVLKMIYFLNSDVNEAKKPVIERSSMLVFNFFWLFSNKIFFSKDVSTGKGEFYSTSSFVFVPQYSWMILLVIWYFCSILIPYLLWVVLMLRRFSVWSFLGVMVKESIKFLH